MLCLRPIRSVTRHNADCIYGLLGAVILMLEPRPATSFLVSALRRKVESEGGFATILKKGDPVAGALLVVCLRQSDSSSIVFNDPDFGPTPLILEREPSFDGPGKWHVTKGQGNEKQQEISEYLTRRQKSDPDLWVIELDVADAERFVAEITLSA